MLMGERSALGPFRQVYWPCWRSEALKSPPDCGIIDSAVCRSTDYEVKWGM